MQAIIASATRCRCASGGASGCSARSFARTIAAMLRPACSPMRSSSAAERNGNGTVGPGGAGRPSSASRAMNPPPTEHQRSTSSSDPAASVAAKASVFGCCGVAARRSKIKSAAGSKAIAGAAGQAQASGRGDRGHQRVGGIGIHRLGRMAREAEDHRLVGAVAASGPGERAEQRDRDPRHPPEQVRAREVGHERARGLHRPDRVRGGGADADLEQLARADHRVLRRPVPACAKRLRSRIRHRARRRARRTAAGAAPLALQAPEPKETR